MNQPTKSNIQLQIINVVWGHKYIQTFLEYSLPAQFSKGNLAHLTTKPNYIIYTNKEGKALIESSEIFKKLENSCHVIFRIISHRPDTCPFDTLLKSHIDAIKQANEIKSPIVFLSPDSIVSAGTFTYCEKAIKEKIRLIAICSARMSLEKYSSIVRKKTKHKEVVTWSPQELAVTTVQNLHYRGKCLVMENDEISAHPSQMYWKLDDNNLLARAYHLHPLLIWPRKHNVYPKISADGKHFLEKICPNFSEWRVVKDCSEFSLFEISSDQQFQDDFKQPRDTFWFSQWLKLNVSKGHEYFFKHKIIIGDGLKKKEWTPVFQRSEKDIQGLYHLLKMQSYLRNKSSLFYKCFLLYHFLIKSFLFYYFLISYVITGKKKLTIRKLSYHLSFIWKYHTYPINTLTPEDRKRFLHSKPPSDTSKMPQKKPSSGAFTHPGMHQRSTKDFLKRQYVFHMFLIKYLITGKKKFTLKKVMNHLRYLHKFHRLPVHILTPEDRSELVKPE